MAKAFCSRVILSAEILKSAPRVYIPASVFLKKFEGHSIATFDGWSGRNRNGMYENARKKYAREKSDSIHKWQRNVGERGEGSMKSGESIMEEAS